MIMAILCATVGAAHADSEELFQEGRELLDAKDFDRGCPKLEQAYAQERTAGIEANLARCAEHYGDVSKAWRLYQSAATKWTNDPDDRDAQMRERAKAVAKRATRVVIRVPDPTLEGLVVSINGREVEPARVIDDVVAPGEIVLVANAPGRIPWKRAPQGQPGETIEVEMDLPVRVKREDTPPTPPVVGTQRRRSRVYLSIGMGVVSLGAFATSFFVAKAANDDYDKIRANPMYCMASGCTPEGDKLIDETQRRADIGTGIGIAGGVLAAGALVVFFTAPRDAVVTPTVTASGGGVSLTARF